MSFLLKIWSKLITCLEISRSWWNSLCQEWISLFEVLSKCYCALKRRLKNLILKREISSYKNPFSKTEPHD
jgi:hypothetical protein